jgi:hypothetical protein
MASITIGLRHRWAKRDPKDGENLIWFNDSFWASNTALKASVAMRGPR